MLFDRSSMKNNRKPPVDAVIMVAGKLSAQGTEAAMTALFQQEAARSRSPIELRVKQADGSYRTKRRSLRIDQNRPADQTVGDL